MQAALQPRHQKEHQHRDQEQGRPLNAPRHGMHRGRHRIGAPFGNPAPVRPAPLDVVVEAVGTRARTAVDHDQRDEHQHVDDPGAHVGGAHRVRATEPFGGTPDQEAEQRAQYVHGLAREAEDKRKRQQGFDDAGRPHEQVGVRRDQIDPEVEPPSRPRRLPVRSVVQISDVVDRKFRRPRECGVGHPDQAEGDPQRGSRHGRPR